MEYLWIDNQHDKTLVLLHGTGGDENDLIPLAQLVAPNMNYLALRGDVVVNGMRRFAKVSAQTGLIDEADMLERVPHVINTLNELKQTYGLGELWILGFSNGANAIVGMLLSNVPLPFTKAVLLRGMDYTTQLPPSDLEKTTVLMHNGRYDDIIPIESTRSLEHRLKQNGAHIAYHLYDASHRLSAPEIADLNSWFEKELTA